MNACRGVEIQVHSSLTSTTDGSEWLTSHPGHSTLGMNPGTHWVEGWTAPDPIWTLAKEENLFEPRIVQHLAAPEEYYNNSNSNNNMFYLNHFLFNNLLHQPYSNNKTTSEEEEAMEVKHYVLKTINFFIPF